MRMHTRLTAAPPAPAAALLVLAAGVQRCARDLLW